MALVGIDLGTTNSLIAIWKDHKVELLPNSLGHNMTPSVVGMDEDGTLLVGEIAKERRISHPDYTAAEFKRHMGTDYKYTLGDKTYLPEELSAILLKKLIADAQKHIEEPITEAVISVPAYFDNNQREATKRAAQIAGIEVKRLVNEPSSAVLYKQWKMGEDARDGIRLVVDFGGGTLDISVVDCFENIIEIMAVSGNNQLGGKDFDLCIAKDFCAKNGLSFDNLRKSTRENILWTAEHVKKALTENESVAMCVNIDDQKYETTYTTKELLQVTSQVLVQMKEVLNDALRGAKIELEDVEEIILVGGSCKMTVVQKYLSALFQRPLTIDPEGDYLVGYGAGVLTGIINRESDISDIVMTDVCPFSLGLASKNDKSDKYPSLSVIIPKNSMLPTSKSQIFSGLVPFQEHLSIHVYQGEEYWCMDNLDLGAFLMDITPNEKGDTAVLVTFSYDIDGLLVVTAKDLIGDHSLEAVITQKATLLTPEEIEQKRQALKEQNILQKFEEENRRILAWAQRLYTQADGANKFALANIIETYSKALPEDSLIAVQKMRKDTIARLLQLEMTIHTDFFGDDDIISQLMDDNTED